MARDVRRFIIQTANAVRVGTAALALSVRAWIEAQRGGVTIRPPVGTPAPVSGPMAAVAAAPVVKADDEPGFSL